MLRPATQSPLGTAYLSPTSELPAFEDRLKFGHHPGRGKPLPVKIRSSKVLDPQVKAVFSVHHAINGHRTRKEVIDKIANLVRTQRPDLMLLTTTSMEHRARFRSLLGELRRTQSASRPVLPK